MGLYYAVIFTSERQVEDLGYAKMADEIEQLAYHQAGFLGIESWGDHQSAVTISYWKDEQSIKNWRNQEQHLQAQHQGKSLWYQKYRIRVCQVERDYQFEQAQK